MAAEISTKAKRSLDKIYIGICHCFRKVIHMAQMAWKEVDKLTEAFSSLLNHLIAKEKGKCELR